jgi:hypothetical protein
LEYVHPLALPVDHILNSRLNSVAGPKVARAAMARPSPAIFLVQRISVQGATVVRFQWDHYALWLEVPGDYQMNVICTNMRG